jgi:hypothetical protein
MKINDSVIHRYDVKLNIEKAANLKFLEENDRINLLQSACSMAVKSISRRADDMYNYESYCAAALALSQISGDLEDLEDSIKRLKAAHVSLGDEHMIGWIGKYESEMARLRGRGSANGS